ncbi:MAG TPA: YgaP-like transmembrane domain [Candidatus Acidoferrales bacterium]|nr:YgaP-like transmembrane domain [Candidatus Acidoferrales bacterium]
MIQNLSPFDRDIRIAIVVPIVLLVAIAAGPLSAIGIAAFMVAAEVAATAFAGYSPFKDLLQGLA